MQKKKKELPSFDTKYNKKSALKVCDVVKQKPVQVHDKPQIWMQSVGIFK